LIFMSNSSLWNVASIAYMLYIVSYTPLEPPPI
jgi:hypothetical protein